MEIKSINVEKSSKELYAKKIVADEYKRPSKAAVEVFRRPAYPKIERK